MFTATATIAVIPNPQKIKHETSCLITAIVDDSIAQYYRHMTNKALHIGILKPSWNSHITISKINPKIPKHFHGRKITFEYTPFVRYSGDNPVIDPSPEWTMKIGRFWFVDVWSDDIRDMRRELELPDYEKFHMTIGVLERPVPNVAKKLMRFS